VHSFIIYLYIFYCGWTLKNFIFFQFSPPTLFLEDLVVIKEQLILNSYEIVRSEEERPK
jgi:hypothetical protein